MGTARYLNSRAHLVQASSTGVTYPSPAVRSVAFSTTVASAGTVATLTTPGAGRRLRVHGGFVTPSAADTVFLRGVASAIFQWNGRGAANTPITLSVPVGGTALGSADAALVLDAGAGGTIVTGTVFVSEEG